MKKFISFLLCATFCVLALPLSFIGCGTIDVEKFIYPAFEKFQDLDKYSTSVAYLKDGKQCVETFMFETVLEDEFSYFKFEENSSTSIEIWFEDRGDEKTYTTRQGSVVRTAELDDVLTVLQEHSFNHSLLLANTHFQTLESLQGADVFTTDNGYSVLLDGKTFEVEGRGVTQISYDNTKIAFDYSLKSNLPTTPNNIASLDALTQFEDVCTKLEKLEALANEYRAQNAVSSSNRKLVLEYLRNVGYNTSQWNELCGTADQNFATFVAENQGEIDVESLKEIDTLVIPSTNEEVDFIHLFATLNMAEQRGLSIEFDLAGYGGDIAQLAADIKSNLLTEEELLAEAKSKLGADVSVFGQADLASDIVAINVANMLKQNTQKPVAEIFKEYATTVGTREQIRLAVKNLNFETNTKTELNSAVFSRVKNNLYIQVWLSNNSTPLSKYETTVRACCTAFADYLLENI